MKENYKIYAKGMGDGERCACGVIVMKDGREMFSGCKVFSDFIPTREGRIPLDEGGSANYQCEVYGLAWGACKIPGGAPFTVCTSSVAVRSWVENMRSNDRYMNIFEYFIRMSFGHKVDVSLVGNGQDKVMRKLRKICLTEV